MKRSTSFTDVQQFRYSQHLPISSQIISFEIEKVKGIFSKNYVNYTVQIHTPYQSWIILKRYSEFYKFHQKLQKFYLRLPSFPPKRLFSNSFSVIQERVQEIDKYMNYILKNLNVLENEVIINFIQIENEVINIFKKSIAFTKDEYEFEKVSSPLSLRRCSSNSSIKETQGSSNDNFYSLVLQFKMYDIDNEKSPNGLVIEEFLRNLDENGENKSEIIRTFENFLKQKGRWPYFTHGEITTFFKGYNPEILNERYINGFLYHVGNVQNNTVGSRICLDFLTKLLSFEFNPLCSEFIKVFKSMRTYRILQMELDQHFTSKINKIERNAFEILNIYFKDIPNKIYNIQIKRILVTKTNVEKFEMWKENENFENY